jgi:hypothetical protein
MNESREILCPHSLRDRNLESWTPSVDNYWWHPKTEHYPNSSVLLPGDVILFRPLKPSAVQRQIISFQRKRYDDAHSGYTHGAIYLGSDGLLCEAVFPGGVQFGSIDDRLEDSCIAVRRAPQISLDLRYSVARAAAGYRGVRYGWEDLLRLRLTPDYTRKRLGSENLSDDVVHSLVCSTLCARALMRGHVSLLAPEKELVVPAQLSAAPELIDIKLEWRVVMPIIARRKGTSGGLDL